MQVYACTDAPTWKYPRLYMPFQERTDDIISERASQQNTGAISGKIKPIPAPVRGTCSLKYLDNTAHQHREHDAKKRDIPPTDVRMPAQVFEPKHQTSTSIHAR